MDWIDPIYKNSFKHLGYIKNTKIIDYNEEKTLEDIEKFKDLIPLTDYTELKHLLKKSTLIGRSQSSIALKDYFDKGPKRKNKKVNNFKMDTKWGIKRI